MGRSMGGAINCGTLTLAGWSDAASGDQCPGGSCRVACAISLMSPTASPSSMGSEFTETLVQISSGVEVHALSEMVDHVTHLREFCAPFTDASPAMIGFEDCEGLFTLIRRRYTVAKKDCARHFSGTGQ